MSASFVPLIASNARESELCRLRNRVRPIQSFKAFLSNPSVCCFLDVFLSASAAWRCNPSLVSGNLAGELLQYFFRQPGFVIVVSPACF